MEILVFLLRKGHKDVNVSRNRKLLGTNDYMQKRDSFRENVHPAGKSSDF